MSRPVDVVAVDADVLVVGGGPVGLVAALHARRAGLDAVVVEPRAHPVDKACGEGIMPAGVTHLAELDVRPAGHDIRGIRYLDGQGRSVAAPFPGGHGLGSARTVLHAALATAVERAGADVVRDRVDHLDQGPDAVTAHLRSGGRLSARYVIAADGLHSPTSRALGLDLPGGARRRRGLRRHLALAPWTDHVEVHWGPLGEAYVTPLADALVGVAILTDRTAPYDELLAGFPRLHARLDGALPVGRDRGAGPLRRRVRRRVAGRVLLAGDAAGYLDAITGEGLTLGWLQARAAVEAVRAGRPEAYERRYQVVGAAGRALTAGLLAASRPAVVRRHLVPVASRLPAAFRGAVAVAASGR